MESALAVPEILEAIFLHLDLQTLLTATPRVSRAWHDVVSTSPALQQALHFQPTTHPVDGPPALNPLLAKHFSPCFFDSGPTASFPRPAESFHALPWTRAPHAIGLAAEATPTLRPVYQLQAPSSPPDPAARRRFTRRGASWRRMLVSQPPPPSLGLLWTDPSTYPEDAQTIFRALAPPPSAGDGVRMAQLYDLVQHHAGLRDAPYLLFRVLFPRPPGFGHATPLCGDVCAALFAATPLVVDMFHDGAEADFDDGGEDRLGGFEEAFRCEEFEEPDAGMEVVTAELRELPGVGRAVVWGTPAIGMLRRQSF